MMGLLAVSIVSSPSGGYIDMDAEMLASLEIISCGAGFWYKTGSSIVRGVSIALGARDVTSDNGLWTRFDFLVKSPARGSEWSDFAFCASLVMAALLLRAGCSSDALPDAEPLCVRSCCFMLSFLVNALLQIGQCTPFSPVCFLPCRAAWPEVVKVAEQLCEVAYGQGYLFFLPVEPFDAFWGDGLVDAVGVEVEVAADCNDGAGVNVCCCCCSVGATGSRGYCEGAMGGRLPMAFDEKCGSWSGIGAIIICCSMNGVMDVGDGRKSWRSRSP